MALDVRDTVPLFTAHDEDGLTRFSYQECAGRTTVISFYPITFFFMPGVGG